MQRNLQVAGYQQGVPDAVFVYSEPRRFKILVVGNCQTEHHAQLARMAFAECSADYIFVHKAQEAGPMEQVGAFLDSTAPYDLVVSFDLDNKWGHLSRAGLEARYGRERIFYIPNLTFDGLQPDMISIGFARAPLGDYHSRIAVGAWLAGADVKMTSRLFNGSTYERLGYFAAYGPAAAEYRRREASTDLAFGDPMFEHINRNIGFFTKNHPTPALFTTFTHELRNALVRQGRAPSSGMPLDAGFVSQSLVSVGAAPIFPEIAEAAGIRHGGSRNYVLPRNGGYAVSLEEFVARSFQAYSEIGHDEIARSPQAADCLARIQGIL
jgi:hypothetical protein